MTHHAVCFREACSFQRADERFLCEPGLVGVKVLSASLNAVVMFLYSGLLIWLNMRSFEAPLRPSLLRVGALVLSFLFFGYFSIIMIADQLQKF